MSETFATSRNTQFSYKKLTLSPGQRSFANVTGNYFYCTESVGSFKVRFNEGESLPCCLGIGFEFNAGDGFSRVEFYNPSASDTVYLEYYTAQGRIIDHRLNVVRDRSQQVITALAPTLVVPQDVEELDAAEEVDLPGTYPGGTPLMRRSIVVSNHATAASGLVLELWTPGGEGAVVDELAAVTIFPQETFQLDTSDHLKLVNPNEVGVICRVTEIFYSIPLSNSSSNPLPSGNTLAGSIVPAAFRYIALADGSTPVQP